MRSSFNSSTNRSMKLPPHKDKRATWFYEFSKVAIDWKTALARHAASHLIDYGTVLQMGPGTTLNFLMDRIVRRQKQEKKALDLEILTTNLQVLERGRDAQYEAPELFNTMQIILTGGFLQPSMHSLVGQYAAEGVRTSSIRPHLVFLGAFGLSFGNGEVFLTYQFENEVSTQVSYATRPTNHRVVLCDHTKLGKKAGWKANVTAESMLDETDRCTFISTHPDGDADAGAIIKREVEGFGKLLERLRKKEDFKHKQLALRLVNKEGETVEEHMLHPPDFHASAN